MSIPRNLSFLAEGASATGVLGVANGGTITSSGGNTIHTFTSSAQSPFTVT